MRRLHCSPLPFRRWQYELQNHPIVNASLNRANETRTVVPRIVIHKRRSIRHTSDLVSVIPPTHDDGILLCVLPQPVISLSEVIDNVLTTVGTSGSQHDRRRRVGVRSDPGTVVDEHDEGADEGEDDEESGVERVDASLCGCRTNGLLGVDRRRFLRLGLVDGRINFSRKITRHGRAIVVNLGNSRVQVGGEKLGECHGGGNAENTRQHP